MRRGGQVGQHRGLLVSLLAHALLVVALLLSPAAPRLLPRPVESVPVHLMSPQEFEAAVRPAPPPAPPPAQAAAPPAPERFAAQPSKAAAAPEASAGMVVARTMLSQKTLADPRSRQARRELATFADGERVVQLCNLEAMDQIAAWRSDFHPDRLVAYARADARLAGDRLEAAGAAFRSSGRWFDVRFDCELAPDHARVVAFRFEVGDAVPRKDWDELGLPAVH